MTYVLLSLLIILQYYDGLTTYRLLSKGGRELNPVVRWFINQFGLRNGLLLVKGNIAVLITWTTLVGIMPVGVLAALCLLYIWVVYHNFTELNK